MVNVPNGNAAGSSLAKAAAASASPLPPVANKRTRKFAKHKKKKGNAAGSSFARAVASASNLPPDVNKRKKIANLAIFAKKKRQRCRLIFSEGSGQCESAGPCCQ